MINKMLTFPPRKFLRTPMNDRAYSLSFFRYFRAFTHYEPGSGSTASEPVSDVSAPACTNGVWPPLRPVSVLQNKPSTMSSSTVQSIDAPRTTRPDGSGRWDNRMAAQYLPRCLGGLAVDKRTRSNERRRTHYELFVSFRSLSFGFNIIRINPLLVIISSKLPAITNAIHKLLWVL